MFHIRSGDQHSCRWANVLIFIHEIIFSIIIIRNEMALPLLLDLQSRLFKGSFFKHEGDVAIKVPWFYVGTLFCGNL
jgi:hypothetical protein